MIKSLSLAALAMVTLTTMTSAADVIVGGEQIPHVGNTFTEKRWDGAYAGVLIGNSNGTVRDIANVQAAPQDTTGLFGGVFVGHNWQFDNNFVLGIEGDVVVGGPSVEWKNPGNGIIFSLLCNV